MNNNIIFITMPIFEDKRRFGTVINFGTLNGDILTYETKAGVQHKNIHEFDSCFKLHKLEDFDWKESLHYWSKERKNQVHYGKPFVIDEELNTGEKYRGNTWHLALLIQPTETEVKVKVIFE